MKRLPMLLSAVATAAALTGLGLLGPTRSATARTSLPAVGETSALIPGLTTAAPTLWMMPQDPPDDQQPPPPPSPPAPGSDNGGRGRWGGGSERGPGGPGNPGTIEGTFEGHMRGAGRALRAIKRALSQPSDPDSAAQSLKGIEALELELVAAKGQIDQVKESDAAKAKFGSDNDAYTKAFRSQLISAVSQALTLETSILEGKMDEAQTNLKKLEEIQGEGHKLFRQPEERRSPGRPPQGGNGG